MPTAPGFFDRLLGRFTDVHPGEGARATLMLLNIFLIMVSYSLLKPVRESLVLGRAVPAWLQAIGISEPAQLKTYSSAGQALLMMAFVPAYSWFASRVDHMKLVLGVTTFYVACIALFAVGVHADVEGIGVFFYIWLGLFNMSIVALFWSYANDFYTKDAGHRLFPVIGVGMTAGAPLGAWIVGRMFAAHVPVHSMLYVAAALLLTTGALYEIVNRGASGHHAAVAKEPIGGKGAFSLIFSSRYISLIVVLLILLNTVNSLGEFLLSSLVDAHGDAALRIDPAFDRGAYVGAFYASYHFWVNITAVILQLIAAPRLVKRFGLAGALFALPFVAMGAYAFITLGATLAVVRWAKTAENATDYSIMNTARQLLWLPTSREEKYKAKQGVDTFFVRVGDVLAALVVVVGTVKLALGIQTLAVLNIL
ncbi:MAG: NTP/NDP exchange transporter, partial [Bacteroidales bacterium]